MTLTHKSILIISPEPWDHIFVSKHHYAVHLARRGNSVYFLNPPSDRVKVTRTSVEGLWVVDYRGFVRGLRFLPRTIRHLITRQVCLNIQKLVGAAFDVVWSFDTSVFYDLDALPGSPATISHIVDLNQNFQTERAARSASICICTTDLIKERLLLHGSRVYKINHGFNHVPVNNGKPLPGRSKVKALYAGNLAMPFIDWTILLEVIESNADVDFVFLGPGANLLSQDRINNTAKKKALGHSNVCIAGIVSAEELVAWYTSADILLISYQERYHRDQSNPHKMMEYLGSGKMVVATFTMEYSNLNERELLVMSKANSDFAENFRRVRENLGYWNSDGMRLARRSIAMDNTYDKQIDRIEALLSNTN